MAPEEHIVDQIISALNKGVRDSTLGNYLAQFDPDGYCDPCIFELYDYREPTYSKKCVGHVHSEPGDILLPEGKIIGNLSIYVRISWPFKDSKSSRNVRRAMRYRAALEKFISFNWENITDVGDLDINGIETFNVMSGTSQYLVTGVDLITRANLTRIIR